MLLVGDKFKQVKPMVGFNFVGREFKVTAVEGVVISFYGEGLGHGVMSMDEFDKFFEKVVAPAWGEWQQHPHFASLQYRLKGDLMEMKHLTTGIHTFSKPHEDDTFNLATGLQVCVDKMVIRELEKEAKELKKAISVLKEKVKTDY